MTVELEDRLMRIHVAAMFDCDVDGHLQYVREPWGDLHAAPRFFMGRTVRGNVWRCRYDLPEELIQQLEVLCRSEPITADITRPPHGITLLKAALQDHKMIVKEERGPAFLVPENVGMQTGAVLVTKDNGSLLQDRFPWILRYILADINIGPVAATVVEGSAVSICYCARLTSSAAEAGVETLEDLRGRGYATKAVGTWATAIREHGLLPLYSTTWTNPSSLRVAHKLRMVCYGEDWLIE
jgi:hypothetical protein